MFAFISEDYGLIDHKKSNFLPKMSNPEQPQVYAYEYKTENKICQKN